MIYTLEDLMIAARTIYGEARNQSYRGQKAVGHVLINRTTKAVDDPDHSLAATALRWRQFSVWNKGDPNRAKALTASVDDPGLRRALRAVCEALDEADFTNGATHYHTRAIDPDWARGHAPCLELDDHLFYNTVD